VHGHGHVHLSLRQLRKRILHSPHQLSTRHHIIDDGIVVVQNGRRKLLRKLLLRAVFTPKVDSDVVPGVPGRASRRAGGILISLGRERLGHEVGERGLRLREVHRVLIRQRLIQRLAHLWSRELARDVHLHRVRVLLQPCAFVRDLLDGGADKRYGGSEPRNAARPVRHNAAEADEPAVVDEPAFEHVAKGGGVDVAAAQKDHHVFASHLGELPGEARRHSSGPRALLHQLLTLHQTKQGHGDILLAHLH